VGAVLFQLLTGSPPFEGNNSQEIVGRHLQEPVPVATLSRDGIPPWLSRIVVRCMAKNPDDRYATARGLRDALRAGRGAATGAEGESDFPDVPAAAPFDEESPTVALPAVRQRRSWGPWLVAGLVLTAAFVGTVAAALAGRPDPFLVVENRLVESIAVTLEDSGYTIASGDSIRIGLARGRPVEANWAVVQPSSLDGRLLGAPVEGSIVMNRARGAIREVVDAETGDVWFVPVVVNRSGRPLRVTVLGRGDSGSCDCTVAAGDSIRLGYYPLDPSSAVRVADPRGLSAQFDSLDERRNPVTGSVVVRVDTSALSRAGPGPPVRQ
jgi:hypothetical protein